MQTLEETLAQMQASLAELHTKIDSLIDKRLEVEPCPVCGNLNIQGEKVGKGTFMRLCMRCSERRLGGNIHLGTICANPQEALAAWNKQSRELRGLKP